MPWQPHFDEEDAREALEGAESWREALSTLNYAYHGKNIATLRKWAARWNLPTDHLSDHRGFRKPRYTDAELREAVSSSLSWAETLRRLSYCPSGGTGER